MSTGYFVGIPIGEQKVGFAHVTIGLRAETTPEEVDMIIRKMKEDLSGVFPIVLSIASEREWFGHDKDIPVHRITIMGEGRKVIEGFYESTYKREATINEILEKSQGVYIASRAELKQLGDKKVLFYVGY